VQKPDGLEAGNKQERKMRTQRRWMKWVLEEAEAPHVAMPWERAVHRPSWKNRIIANEIERVSVPV